jgi:hypothetical protein
MPTTRTYKIKNGKAKVQVEDLIGAKDYGGWNYVKPGQGNNGAEGAHYYYKSQTKQGSHKSVPGNGHFSFKIDIDDPGQYKILVRAARDTSNPPDARNDIWIKVDGGTQGMMPKGTAKLTSGGDGFVKFKGSPSKNWNNLNQFSTPKHGDKNPAPVVVLDEGMHKIEFAPRSTGLHIDSIQVLKKGVKAGGGSSSPEPDKGDGPKAGGGNNDGGNNDGGNNGGNNGGGGGNGARDVLTAEIARRGDDFESNKAGPSKDLEFGRDSKAQTVGLRFKGLELDEDVDIKKAYFVFQAKENSKGNAKFEIEVEKTTSAKGYTKGNAPDDRKYLAEDVDWNVETWKAGKTYKSADISDLIEAVIKDGGLDAMDALAFRIGGSGERVAHSFESNGDAPQLVIETA